VTAPATNLNQIHLCVALFTAIFVPRIYAISPVVAPRATAPPGPDSGSGLAVLIEAHRLSNEYGSRPLYNSPAVPKNSDFSLEQTDAVIPYLIACESRDRRIKDVDSNGFYSYGILQIQSSTVASSNGIDHTDFDPITPVQAVQRAEIAIQNGYLHRWSCAHILGVV
jgi:hypothetical protein